MEKYKETQPNELMHYGVLGMKWGVRKYQNPDGSLKPLGKERYGPNKRLNPRTGKMMVFSKETSEKDMNKAARALTPKETMVLNKMERNKKKYDNKRMRGDFTDIDAAKEKLSALKLNEKFLEVKAEGNVKWENKRAEINKKIEAIETKKKEKKQKELDKANVIKTINLTKDPRELSDKDLKIARDRLKMESEYVNYTKQLGGNVKEDPKKKFVREAIVEPGKSVLKDATQEYVKKKTKGLVNELIK